MTWESAIGAYKVESRYMVPGIGWKLETLEMNCSYYQASARARSIASTLDTQFGEDHFWTVDLKDGMNNGSYFQLFHGRLS